MRGQHDGFQHSNRIGYKVVGSDELVGQHNCVRWWLNEDKQQRRASTWNGRLRVFKFKFKLCQWRCSGCRSSKFHFLLRSWIAWTAMSATRMFKTSSWFRRRIRGEDFMLLCCSQEFSTRRPSPCHPLGRTSSTHDVLEERGRRDARESTLTGRKLFALLEGYLRILWTVRCSEAKSKWCVSFLLCVPLPHRRLFSCRLPASPAMATFQTCRNLLRHSDASLKP